MRSTSQTRNSQNSGVQDHYCHLPEAHSGAGRASQVGSQGHRSWTFQSLLRGEYSELDIFTVTTFIEISVSTPVSPTQQLFKKPHFIFLPFILVCTVYAFCRPKPLNSRNILKPWWILSPFVLISKMASLQRWSYSFAFVNIFTKSSIILLANDWFTNVSLSKVFLLHTLDQSTVRLINLRYFMISFIFTPAKCVLPCYWITLCLCIVVSQWQQICDHHGKDSDCYTWWYSVSERNTQHEDSEMLRCQGTSTIATKTQTLYIFLL